MDTIKLLSIEYIPQTLENGFLYVSLKYSVAAHICPCGCGNKVVTPLGAMEWKFTCRKNKPTLKPSIGNWQLPCKSHYWITNGKIEWSYQISDEEIKETYDRESKQYKAYIARKKKKRKSLLRKILNRAKLVYA